MTTTSRPPMTPPIIAPIGVDFLEEDGVGVTEGAANEEFVESGKSRRAHLG